MIHGITCTLAWLCVVAVEWRALSTSRLIELNVTVGLLPVLGDVGGDPFGDGPGPRTIVLRPGAVVSCLHGRRSAPVIGECLFRPREEFLHRSGTRRG